VEKKRLKAVHDFDLEKLLKTLRIFDDIQNKKKKCKFCKGIITPRKIYAIFPESCDIKIVCDEKDCIKALSRYLNQGNLSD